MNKKVEKIGLELFGASHAPTVGGILTGIAEGESISLFELQTYCDRRRAKSESFSTARREKDEILIKQGIINGRSTGEPIVFEFKNEDVQRDAYEKNRTVPRPSHADYPAIVKYGAAFDNSGGGVFSGRMTAAIVAAGGICIQLLKKMGVTVKAYVSEIADVYGGGYGDKSFFEETFSRPTGKVLPVFSREEEMLKAIQSAAEAGDSVGGIVECVALGVPAGSGEPTVNGLKSKIAEYVFGIPAVKGLEFGTGFSMAKMRGSEANDPYRFSDGKIEIMRNNNGGILGGLATGAPICFRVAIKPTPSIFIEQDSVDLATGKNVRLRTEGRHDACIAPRAAVCIESCAALALMNFLYR